jgi:hypothetical protein
MANMRGLVSGLPLCLALISNARAELGDQLAVGERVLRLNGSGVRTKTFVQVYEAGLYLLKPATDAQTVLDSDEPMAVRIKVTSGLVSRASLVSSLKEGLAQANRENPDGFARETMQLQNLLQAEIKKNDTYDFVYLPSEGLNVLRNGKTLGTVPGLAFKKAFFGIWLSDYPVDKDLRKRMLSGRATAN